MSNPNQEITPDQLLESFRGRSFKSVILFTVIAHLVIIGGTSIPYLIETVSGKSESKLSEEERSEMAVKEATSAIREIATKYAIKPQDLSSRIAGNSPKAPAAEGSETETATPVAPETSTATETQPESGKPAEVEKPQSAIEKELEVKADGPTVPPIPVEEATEEDLFR